MGEYSGAKPRDNKPVKLERLAFMGVLVALGTGVAHLLWFPAGLAKAFPVQHLINVVAAVTVGARGAVLVAGAVGLLRNLFGLGTLFAFPGGMIGAALAGYLYRRTGRVSMAVAGEVIGTGLLGAIASFFLARFILGRAEVAAFTFVPAFTVSSASGAVLAYMVLRLIPASYRASLEPSPASQTAAEVNGKR